MYIYKHFIPENVAPKGAKRIGVYDGDGKRICTVPLGRLAPVEKEPLYSFGLVSDCHTFKTATVADGEWKGNQKLKNALSYFSAQGCAFVIGCGDFTQTGFYLNSSTDYNESQMLNYKEMIDQYAIPIFEIFGNHENYNGRNITDNLARAKELTRIPATAYTVSSAPDADTVEGTTVRPNRYAPVEDDLYILCGQSTSGGVMSADDYDWLVKMLSDNTDRRCFVVVHSYMEEDSGDPLDYRENSIFGTWTKTAEFVALLKQYPNVILFHGHSHMKFEYQEDDTIANYATVKGYKSVHVPSLGMPRDIVPDAADGKYTPEDFKSSQCYRVEVYDDRITLSGLELGTSGVPAAEVLGTLKIMTK